MRRPHVRGALPFLRSGPTWRVHEGGRPALDAFLAEAGYDRLVLDGRRMTSRDAAHTELGRVFGFPDWYGHNWDAWNDCIRAWAHDHDGALVAIVLEHADEFAAAAPVTWGETLWALLLLREQHLWPPEPGAPPRPVVAIDVFTLGTGPDFDAP